MHVCMPPTPPKNPLHITGSASRKIRGKKKAGEGLGFET